jgi:plastocyanin
MTYIGFLSARRIAIVLAALTLLLAMVGLRGELATAQPTAQASKATTVSIKSFEFHPGTLTIAKGTNVSFANGSAVSHTATRDGSFDTGVIKPGKSVLVRFAKKGTFAYHCEIHPLMHGKIIVQ